MLAIVLLMVDRLTDVIFFALKTCPLPRGQPAAGKTRVVFLTSKVRFAPFELRGFARGETAVPHALIDPVVLLMLTPVDAVVMRRGGLRGDWGYHRPEQRGGNEKHCKGRIHRLAPD
ncbi:MAG: hypothetical protein JWQ02_619 [Capsulimonas sp.]|nr:hypothetical protein [Capsulimonas sp.]